MCSGVHVHTCMCVSLNATNLGHLGDSVVKHLTSAQVMVSQLVSSSPASGEHEPASGELQPSFR